MTARRLPWLHLLLLGFVFAGLFVMHGVQATPSPDQASGALVSAMASEHGMGLDHDMATDAAPAAERAMPASPHGPAGHSEHAHPGGAVCFALLVIAGLILLLVGVHTGLRWPRPTAPGLLLVRRCTPRARPPTVYQLSVLRL